MLRCVCRVIRASLAIGTTVVMVGGFAARALAQHMAIVEWAADLTPAQKPIRGANMLMVQTHAGGKVTADVDFPSRTVTFHVDTEGLSGVQKIEVRADASPAGVAGPTIFTIYDASDGPFTRSLTKCVGGRAFLAVATPILNSQAAVVISTSANPDGELAGKITMRKSYEP